MTEQSNDLWTVGRVIDWTTGHLRKHGSDTPRLDAEILLAQAKSCPRIQLYTCYNEVLDESVRAVMRDLVKRRAAAEPVAYLVGHREFYSLDFRITPNVLIPRPDTETLVLELLTLAANQPSLRILEIGTGSGCISISTAVNLPEASITATDISREALDVARENAARHRVEDRILFLEGDLFSVLENEPPFDFLVSNPPYVTLADWKQLDPGVRDHEPKLALCGGERGTEVIERLLAGAGERLKSGGHLMLEIGDEQGTVLPKLIADTGDFEEARIVKDLAGRPRVAAARRV